MKILLANPRCYCAGVQRAVEIVELALRRFGSPVFVRKEIVHNSFVVNRLREAGAIFIDDLHGLPPRCVVVFSAHGVTPAVYQQAEQLGLHVIDATCPLVSKVHSEARRYAAQGYHIVLVGKAGHEEVVGTLGQVPGKITLIENLEQASREQLPSGKKIMVLTQTTLSVDDAEEIIEALRRRFGEVSQPPANDICYATQNRQNAVKQMCAAGIDLLLVVGSPNSSNAARLAEVARVRGVDARLINCDADLCAEWLERVSIIGVTGGASTPEDVVQSVINRLLTAGGESVDVCDTATENVVFQLPPELR